jgi:hypothetical protein
MFFLDLQDWIKIKGKVLYESLYLLNVCIFIQLAFLKLSIINKVDIKIKNGSGQTTGMCSLAWLCTGCNG